MTSSGKLLCATCFAIAFYIACDIFVKWFAPQTILMQALNGTLLR